MTAALTVDVPAGTWTIDPAHSSVGFSVRHLMGRVRGRFEEFSGQVTTAEQADGCTATATIAMASVNTGNPMRDDDLRSANFFDVAQFPDMTFESTGLAGGDDQWELRGRLTIRGVTRDVVLAVEFLGLDETGLMGEQRIGLSATTTILRSDYGVGATGLEGQKIVVGDKITVQLDVQAALGA
ncbi:YceI family protein [Labedaea rhizosphaerae]|uniref:Polyisoprenoid-binding protein YceI n=1 Tax=Labedaea rhizosphaerae TaxID=598644 RepID=A0A4R6SCS1_LABRH|nr:YceI family protein [Labedaea rhizosphaerae]TDP97732.1 polyisoprenoid-binding protein YceI [Labedaea rhizosphaerae]